MYRRQFLAAAAALSAVSSLQAKSRFPWSRFAVLTDEVANTNEDAIAFCRQYGIRNVELRECFPKKHYGLLPEDEAKLEAKRFADAGLKITFLNTPFFKYALPGTEPVTSRPETDEARAKRIAREKEQFDKRKEEMQIAFRNCHIYGVDKMRVFTFRRTANPESVFPRVAEVLSELAEMAAKEKIRLLVENESSCNVATSAELAALLKRMPQKNVGFNWDPRNGFGKETAFPDGYNLLPKERMWNVQLKADSLLYDQYKLDWAGIFDRLAADGYKGYAGLETHIFDGTKVEKAHMSVREIQRILGRQS